MFLAATEALTFYHQPLQVHFQWSTIVISALTVIFGFILYPLAGAAGDIFCGRYTTLLYSVAIMSIGMALGAVISVVQAIKFEIFAYYILLPILWTGLSFFLVVVVQFGADQLQEAGSAELCKWVRRSTYAFLMGRMCSDAFLRSCALSIDLERMFIPVGTLTALSAVGLLGMLIAIKKQKKGFVIEPKSDSPYKVIIQVLNFARKHKCPIRRSALTYWEQEIPSRIDLAKTKYGGFFTNEQVEDVKTFIRLIGMLVAMTIWPAAGLFTVNQFDIMYPHMDKDIGTSITNHNFTVQTFVAMSNTIPLVTAVILVTLYEFLLLCTCVGKFLPGTLQCYAIGLILSCISPAALLTLDTIGHVLHSNASCIFYQYQNGTYNIPINISAFAMTPLTAINVVANFLTYVTVLQFILAQAPYSMRGSLVGFFYFALFFFRMLLLLLVLPFSLPNLKHIVSYHPLSCGFGYLALNVVLAVASLVIFCVAMKKYKYRQRDDPVNDHLYQFAENYYSNSLN